MGFYTLLVFTNVRQGEDEQEFNRWYSDQHLADVISIPGFLSARRYRMVEAVDVPGFDTSSSKAEDASWRYCATYFLETDDPQGAMKEMFSRIGGPKMPISDTLDPAVHVLLYEAITPTIGKS